MDEIPGIEIEIIELMTRKDMSSRFIQTIWIKKPMIKLTS